MTVNVAAQPENLRESGQKTTGSDLCQQLRQKCKPQAFWHLLEKKLLGYSERLR
jgi:hypothetical protein